MPIHSVWSQSEHLGCELTQSYLEGTSHSPGSEIIPDISRGPHRRTPAVSHGYTMLYFNEKLTEEALCRTNKDGEDDNYVVAAKSTSCRSSCH